jgi:hypothetical protein
VKKLSAVKKKKEDTRKKTALKHAGIVAKVAKKSKVTHKKDSSTDPQLRK